MSVPAASSTDPTSTVPAPVAGAGAGRPVTPADVGWQFVPQYYTFVNKQPHKLHCFYNRNSTFTHGTEGEDVKHLSGQAQIHDKIVSLGYHDCKVYINSVDAQSSMAGGIIIQVIGEMSNNGEPWKKFAQTFFLAEQPNGYYVLNDIFRFLKEETLAEGDEAEAEAEPSEPAPVEPSQAEPVSGTAQTESAMDAAAQQPQALNGFHPELEKESEPAEDLVHNEPEEPVQVEEAVPPMPEEPAHSIVVAPSAQTAEEPAPTPATVAPVTAPEPAAPKEVPAKVVDVAPPMPEQPAQSTVVAPTPATAPAAPAQPAQPAAPAPPPGPKTWAALASKDSNRWGANVASEARGVSAAPPPSRTPAAPAPSPAPSQGARPPTSQGPPPAAPAPVTTAQCFIKNVTEAVSKTALADVLMNRFGPIKELEIVRSKACAFLEFTSVESAAKAIQASLPTSQGGQGSVRVPVEGGGYVPVHIETRKERGERPVSRPRGGGPGQQGQTGQGEGRGAGNYRGRGEGRGTGRGGERGRGRGQGQNQQQQK
ncbi:NTF2-domain-containing protein [Dacryopinax primogenitus]|uniref:NTF2-domain-containing protein n=1 Tax=Dacryopinax primogenitus (strain DJM 731) TaxID=1858805 RepID=M5G8H5_DACPD|nr:NTF2-domain-containing protein [Dacryopinax primogenitus]EJU02152.1 NTF2-domain-containing protein [Dacryopinax primogenitus]